MISLNDYISAHAGRIDDIDFLKEYLDTEVFFPIAESTVPLTPGTVVPPGARLRYEVARTEAGKMAVLYASKNDARLVSPYGGVPLRDAIKMLVALSDIDGVLIRNDKEDWFAANKAAMMDLV